MVNYRYLYIFFCIPLPLVKKVGFPVSTTARLDGMLVESAENEIAVDDEEGLENQHAWSTR